MNNGDKPAMPVDGATWEAFTDGMPVVVGLTKREYAAIAAMQGLVAGAYANTDVMQKLAKDFAESGKEPPESVAEQAVEYADALMAALEEG